MVERTIEEYVINGKRLGRHVQHDPRSRAFAYEEALTTTFKTVHHRRYGAVLDQGNVGSCTGNAAAGVVNTMPIHYAGERLLKEVDALELYHMATVYDGYPGTYPPDDTGSSGLAAAKAAKSKGYITSYQHAFSMQAALTALMTYPVITGIDWYEGFDKPDVNGLVKIEGQVRGGHEIEVKGFTLRSPLSASLILCENSWGIEWGLRGDFHFTVATWQQLLDAQGDVTVLIR